MQEIGAGRNASFMPSMGKDHRRIVIFLQAMTMMIVVIYWTLLPGKNFEIKGFTTQK
jgi:hypothetical protein